MQITDNQNHTVQRLKEAISDVICRLRNPLSVMLSPFGLEMNDTDDHSRALIKNLHVETEAHLQIIFQLRVKCTGLLQSEKQLRNQIYSLVRLVELPIQHHQLSPHGFSQCMNSLKNALRIEDLQSAIVQITLQLQNDSQNVNNVTNHLTQIIRDRDEWKNRIGGLEQELAQKIAHIRELERVEEYFNIRIDILQNENEDLKRQVENITQDMHEERQEQHDVEIRGWKTKLDKANGIIIRLKKEVDNRTQIELHALVDRIQKQIQIMENIVVEREPKLPYKAGKHMIIQLTINLETLITELKKNYVTREEIGSLKMTLQKKEEEIDQIARERNEYRKQVQTVTSANENLKSERDVFKSSWNETEESAKDCGRNLQTAERTIAELRAQLQRQAGCYCGRSKQCCTGLGIGLAIGILLVIIIAVPIGVTKNSSSGTKSSTPNWIGTFRVDDTCDTGTCCCLTNEVVLSETGHNSIRIIANRTGQCGNLSSTSSLIQPMPRGFQAYFQLYRQAYHFQLGQDSSCISSVNASRAYCSSHLLRTSHNTGQMKSMNLGLIMFILSLTIGIMI